MACSLPLYKFARFLESESCNDQMLYQLNLNPLTNHAYNEIKHDRSVNRTANVG